MGKNVDIKKISRQIFPNHTELGAYNQLAGKIGRRPLNQKEYDELKRTKRRPDSEINSENKTRNMTKNVIRLTESDLHRIVKESVNRVLMEVQWKDSEGRIHSTHGDNADDWNLVSNERGDRANRVDPTLGRRGGTYSDMSKDEFHDFAKNREGEARDRAHFYSTTPNDKGEFEDLAQQHFDRSKRWQRYRKKGN